ncbi:hypothetical protein SLEP1_g39133 [Rubroshorea leprosula]|uniref:Uncharacterized protein n=1 Tax=Rubroshorea leprosula TaxID=152421 RepID=A0AAV5KZY8_9ROSI|nr:hypothetical protein SLEP1_g39133 [Rubroshorea leprosula]
MNFLMVGLGATENIGGRSFLEPVTAMALYVWFHVGKRHVAIS